MRVRDISVVLAVMVTCAAALAPAGRATSAQERGAAAAPGGAVDAPQGPGRGLGAGRGRGPAANEPRGVRVKTEAATPGYLLFAPLNSDATFLIDNDGQVVRTWKSDVSPGAAVVMLDNGNIVRAGFEPKTQGFNGGGQGGRFQEFTFDGELLWEHSINDASRLSHHDFAVMPNGNILAIVWDLKSADEARRVGRRDGFIPASGVWPDLIVELQPQRPKGARVVWEWHAWDHLVQDVSPSMPNYAKPSERPERIDINGDIPGAKPVAANVTADILHTNAIAYNAELDQIALSIPRFNEIWVIDHSTTSAQARGSNGGRSGKGGDLLYRWGNPQAYGRGTESDRRFGFQHDVRWIPRGYPGAGHMTVFSNRSGGPGPNVNQTTVYEFATPVDAKGRYPLEAGKTFGPGEPLWTYSAADLQAQFISGASRLADGKMLISSGPQGRVFEITPEGRIVWEYWSPFTGSLGGAQGKANPYALFRATRIPTSHPALKGRTLRPVTPQPPLTSP